MLDGLVIKTLQETLTGKNLSVIVDEIMNTPIIDLEELLDEAKDRIEEKLIIEGEIENV